MTLKKLVVKEYGMRGFKELSPRLKKLIKDIDVLNKGLKPLSRRQIEKALA